MILTGDQNELERALKCNVLYSVQHFLICGLHNLLSIWVRNAQIRLGLNEALKVF